VSTVLSWNVQGRVRTVEAQAAALADQPADVVALQEVRITSMAAWRAALRALGHEHVVTTLDAHDPRVRLAPDRRLGVLLASRQPIELLPGPEVPWHERLLIARGAGGRRARRDLQPPLADLQQAR
jgi:exonuclease III